jgi:hypothetical protein
MLYLGCFCTPHFFPRGNNGGALDSSARRIGTVTSPQYTRALLRGPRLGVSLKDISSIKTNLVHLADNLIRFVDIKGFLTNSFMT